LFTTAETKTRGPANAGLLCVEAPRSYGRAIVIGAPPSAGVSSPYRGNGHIAIWIEETAMHSIRRTHWLSRRLQTPARWLALALGVVVGAAASAVTVRAEERFESWPLL
jgi:hypothetical protein